MPSKPLHKCNHPSCRAIVSGAYCDQHQPKREDRRESSSKRGYNYRWQKESRRFLDTNPWCFYCKLQKILSAATEVDHFIPHRGDAQLFRDKKNWRAACKKCHSAKTAREDGGFGNPSPTPSKKPMRSR